MPSPLGHALGGVIAGWLVAGDPARRAWAAASGSADTTVRGSLAASPRARQGALFAALGMAADADLLVGSHSTYSHSVGAVLVVLLVALAVGRSRSPQPVRLAVAVAAAYGSHVLLDWLGSDTTPPIGIMALWPVSHDFYQSSHHLFDAISRRYWLPGFWAHNLLAMAREALILVPPLLVVWRMRGGPASGAGREAGALAWPPPDRGAGP